MYRDCLTNVRPKLKLYKNLEQAKEAIKKLQEKLYPQLKELTEQVNEDDSKNLHPIPEDSEFDDQVIKSILNGRRQIFENFHI